MSLVRARIGAQEVNVSPEYAAAKGLEVLDEPTHTPDGQIRPATRHGGRPMKPLTTVDAEAEKKKQKQQAGQPSALNTNRSED